MSFPKRLRAGSGAANYGYGLKVEFCSFVDAAAAAAAVVVAAAAVAAAAAAVVVVVLALRSISSSLINCLHFSGNRRRFKLQS